MNESCALVEGARGMFIFIPRFTLHMRTYFLQILPATIAFAFVMSACESKKTGEATTAVVQDSAAKWDQEAAMSDGMIRVKKGSKYGFLNANRQVVISPEWDLAFDFKNGYSIVKRNQKYGYIDHQGKLVIPCKFDRGGYFYEGKAAVLVGHQWGYINHEGNEVIAPQFPDVKEFSEGMAPVRLTEQWGYIDSTGKVVIPAQYEDAWPYREGLAHCFKGGYWGYLDKKGKTAIPFIYLNAGEFEGTAAPAQRKDGSWIQIDRTGKCVAFCDEKGDLGQQSSDARGMITASTMATAIKPLLHS